MYSFLAPQQVTGPFQIGLQTRGGQAEEALGVVRATLATFLAEGPSAQELQAARDNIINGFGLRLDANAKLLDHVAMIGFYRLPLDWLDRYPRQVEAVTVEAVRDAWQRRIRPEQLVTVIAGGDGDRSAAPAADAAPVPAKRSTQAWPSRSWPSQLNSVSRTRSGVGRSPGTAVTSSRRERHSPPTMRTRLTARLPRGAWRRLPQRRRGGRRRRRRSR